MCEYPSCISETWPTARKSHRCVECGGEIKAGEKYHKITGVWDNQGQTYKQCSDCSPIYSAQLKLDSDLAFGEMFESPLDLNDESLISEFDRIAVKRGMLTIQQLRDKAKRLDDERIAECKAKYPNA